MMAWDIPLSIVNDHADAVEGSTLLKEQRRLAAASIRTLKSVAVDVRAGLAETVGVGAELSEGVRSSVVIELPVLPDGIETEYIARAIDAENVEAWCDERGQVHVAVSPWYSTKDVDQVVLSVTKVVHVLLGLHADDSRLTSERSSVWRRMIAAATEIAVLQKPANKN